VNGGRLNVTGNLTINGTYHQLATGVVRFEVFDSQRWTALQVHGGAATLDGTLEVIVGGAVTLAAGDRFRLITVNVGEAIDGDFSAWSFAPLSGGLNLRHLLVEQLWSEVSVY
jgi:hypothetical protein